MIVNYCRYSGLPLAVVPMFMDMNIKAISEHPIFALPSRKLIELATSVKVTQVTQEERVLMGLALARTTGLVKFQTCLRVKERKTSEAVTASFLLAARNLAKVYQDLVAAPKQIAVMVNQLPLFRVSEDTDVSELTNWCKIATVRASAYVETGRERKANDEHYGFTMSFLEGDGSKLSRNKQPIKNSDYSLPQIYDADIGVWAYDAMTDNFSEEVIREQAAKFQACYNLLTMTGSNPKASLIATLRDTLDSILPLDGTLNERRKQLVIAYLDKKHSDIICTTAELLGENVSSEVRQVGNKQWSYAVLAPVESGSVSGGTGASIARKDSPTVKAGQATSGIAAGLGLDSGNPRASIAPAAPSPATAQMVANLRARMNKRGLGR